MAAANRTVTTLSIALIVFVMLTFVLAVTTYLFFKQRMDEQLRREDAVKEANGLRENLLAAQGEAGKLREIIGVQPEETIEQVETGFNELLQRDFSDFNRQPRSYLTLTAWLREQFRTWAGETGTADAKAKQAEAEAERIRKQAEEAVAAARKDAEAARQQQSAEKQDFDDKWKRHEGELRSLLAEKEKAEKQVEAFNLLVTEIDKAEQWLPPEVQREFRARPTQEKLDVVYKELRDRRKEIERQNKLLATLRVADRAMQEQVLAATPGDDRIDGFDGRVVSVDAGDRTAMVSFSSTSGMRPGLVLSVFDPADPRPKASARKGVLEVTAVEGATRARVRIRQDSARNPILAGDGVASSLWSAGTSPEVVIAGFVNLDDDAEPDLDALVGAVQRTGARVVDKLTASTTYVVDAGRPPASVSGPPADGKAAGDDAEAEAKQDEGLRDRRADAGRVNERRDRLLQEAKDRGIKVITVDGLLDVLGIDRASFDVGRLPRTGSARPAATR